MTSIKRISADDQNDDVLGPKFRHRLGPVNPNVIFSREHDKAARLYQDIILYSISHQYHDLLQKQKEQGQPRGFKVNDIGDWLLDHNPDYIEYYTDSKSRIPKGRRKNNIYKRVIRYLDNLEKWFIVKR